MYRYLFLPLVLFCIHFTYAQEIKASISILEKKVSIEVPKYDTSENKYIQHLIEFENQDFKRTPMLRMVYSNHSTYDIACTVRFSKVAFPHVVRLLKKDTSRDTLYFQFDSGWEVDSLYNTSNQSQHDSMLLEFFQYDANATATSVIELHNIEMISFKSEKYELSDESMIISNCDRPMQLWWPCKKEKVHLDKSNENVLEIEINDGQWDCFGMVFNTIDASNYRYLRVRAKMESETNTYTNIMGRIIDIHEKSTDLRDGDNMQILTNEYKDFYFDFEGFSTSNGNFDSTHVNRFIVFINMNKATDFNGKVYVKQVALEKCRPHHKRLNTGCIASYTKSVFDSIDNPAHRFGFNESICDYNNLLYDTHKKVPKSKGNNQLEIINIPSNRQFRVSRNKDGYRISAKANELYKRSFSITIDSFNIVNNPYFQLDISANQDMVLDIYPEDVEGIIGNGRPIEVKVRKGHSSYSFMLRSENFRRIDAMEINSNNISKLHVRVNGGLSSKMDEKFTIHHLKSINTDIYYKSKSENPLKLH